MWHSIGNVLSFTAGVRFRSAELLNLVRCRSGEAKTAAGGGSWVRSRGKNGSTPASTGQCAKEWARLVWFGGRPQSVGQVGQLSG